MSVNDHLQEKNLAQSVIRLSEPSDIKLFLIYPSRAETFRQNRSTISSVGHLDFVDIPLALRYTDNRHADQWQSLWKTIGRSDGTPVNFLPETAMILGEGRRKV